MQLVMRRQRIFHIWHNFHINARMVVEREENSILAKYLLYDTIITEGNIWRDIRRAVMISFVIAFIVTALIYKRNDIGLFPLIFLFFTILLALSYVTYHQIREEVRVNDLLTGRDFKARSLIGLLSKEHNIRKMAAVFAKVVEQARTWEEPEVIDLQPQPLFSILEGYDREAA
jgi:hypothetical protein